ncbi:Fe-S oxidoreductase [Schinkia azotoformans MEV2011]|uniref:Glycolate oxidase iron-sulfur subunit n=1 Tax=Schinkia azotoformans MEV2011 TaxID=1348973 RepID=A0A072NQP4_SCHAZ|nr:(Fe-S)-binding protein [Schinkia azotoformans]KEF39999.1 Fe-S oxidoreductase [Schinkia azotoformans MEV2011]MEC1694695.1 (Fe-S)-binding protein [Schinkia azotoformans]MEC1726378.1 (Fe-S)-binding protein [Schinkia azotoformans]MEC1744810.1 (Fe-S)-binding protein [Schinkia azotoformans]MEC1756982.1 (Fe-S)-binding protein [Schinkia azotoformans]
MTAVKKEMNPIPGDLHSKKLFDLTYEDTNKCIQCGYCLPVCPTYKMMGKETASPRGRINLVKMAAERKIDIEEHLTEPIDLCLGCRACEVACPVNVPYGHILESAKEVITEKQTKQNHIKKQGKIKKLVLTKLFPYPTRMRAVGNMFWLYQALRVNKLVQKTKIIEKISPSMAQFEKVLPKLESPTKRNQIGQVIPAKGTKKARVGFFIGCIMDGLMYKINRQSIELLSLAGCEVVVVQEQQCCGALHSHQGMNKEARGLAKENIIVFEKSGADYYVNNAGGCGAMLHEYDHLLDDEPEWKERARQFVSKTKDISQLLVQFGPLPFKKDWEGIITYQDSCHLRNVQGIIEPPRQLLKSIPGAMYIELKSSHMCCGSGGIYNLLHFEESMMILDDKMKDILSTKARTIVTTNPGCLLQMNLGVERTSSAVPLRSLHLVEVLAEACGL